MAEKADAVVWNKKLLVISLILGVLAVALFYLYESIQESRIKGSQTEYLRWRRAMSVNDMVKIDDVEVVPVSEAGSAAFLGALKNTDDDLNLVKDGRLTRAVQKGEPVFAVQFIGGASRGPAHALTPGCRAFPIQVDPLYTTGGFLRFNDRVDLLGMVLIKGKPRTMTLIENLRVVGIGGSAESPDDAGKAKGYDPARTVYRTITVEVRKEAVVNLQELLARVVGKLTVAVRPPTETKVQWEDKGNPSGHSAINPVVVDEVLSKPLPELPAGGGPGGP